MTSTKFSLNCTECRAKKVKCDRGNPCSNCRKRGLICQNELLRKPNRSRTYRTTAATRQPQTSIPSSLTGSRGDSSSDHVRLRDGVDLSIWQSNHLGYTGGTPSDQPVQEATTSADSDLNETQSVPQVLNDILFSNELLSQLFGTFDDTISIDAVKEGINSLPSIVSPDDDTAPNLQAAPVPDTLCISRFNRDAGNLSLQILKEYKDMLPNQHDVNTLMNTLKKPTALSSTGSSLSTVLDTDTFARMLQQHGEKLLQLDSSPPPPPPPNGLIAASEVFYVVCALFYASSVDKSSSPPKNKHLPLIIKLNKHLTGLDPSLMLMQACRLWFMGCMQFNLVEEAAAAITVGGRTAVSMGIHKFGVMIKQPAQQRPLLIDALINLVCDGCFIRAVFAVETPILPASMDPSIFYLEGDSRDDDAVEGSTTAGVNRPLPLIVRLHASTWIFIGRYYHRQGRLRVPTEQDLTLSPPVDEAEEFEISQLVAISMILHHCALELERPLSLWLSFQDPSSEQQWSSLDSSTTTQSTRALQMLYLIRYYRILINYPFIHVMQDSLEAVVVAARSTINTTWRLARRGATQFQDNLALYGHICLRAISFLAACRSHQQHLKPYPIKISVRDEKGQNMDCDQNCMGPDKLEQIRADLELGVDALDKLDRVLNLPVSFASLASAHLLKTSVK